MNLKFFDMDKYNTVLGIGADTYSDEPWLGTPSGSTTPTSTKKSLTDTLSDWLGLAKEGAGIFQTVKSGSGSSVTYNVASNQPPPASNNTMKYVLIGGGALLAVAAAVLLTTRSKKGVGSIKPATKRSKQKK